MFSFSHHTVAHRYEEIRRKGKTLHQLFYYNILLRSIGFLTRMWDGPLIWSLAQRTASEMSLTLLRDSFKRDSFKSSLNRPILKLLLVMAYAESYFRTNTCDHARYYYVLQASINLFLGEHAAIIRNLDIHSRGQNLAGSNQFVISQLRVCEFAHVQIYQSSNIYPEPPLQMTLAQLCGRGKVNSQHCRSLSYFHKSSFFLTL